MPPTKIVITKNREINQAQAASPPPLRTTYVNARFRIHKTSQTVSAATLSPLRIYIIAFSNLFYNKITRLFAFYISVFRVFAPYPHALRPLRPCDKKPPRPKPRRRSGFCGTNDPRASRTCLCLAHATVSNDVLSLFTIVEYDKNERSKWLTVRINIIIESMRSLEASIRSCKKDELYGVNSFPEAEKLNTVPVAVDNQTFSTFINSFINVLLNL